MLNVELFPKIDIVRPTLKVGVSWAELAASFTPHRPVLGIEQRKQEVPLFSPAEHFRGMVAGNAGVVCVHFGVADLDGLEDIELGSILQTLSAAGIAHVMTTSFSHREKRSNPGKACVRIVYPFSRPVQASEWSIFWDETNARLFGGRNDPATKDIGHRFWVPCFREGTQHPPEYRNVPGGALNVDAIIGAARPAASSPVAGARGGETLTRESLRRLAKTLSNAKSKAFLGAALYAICKGESYAEQGKRTTTTFRLVCEIVDRYPLVDPAVVAAHFSPSLQAMQPTKMTVERIEAMVLQKAKEPRADHTTRIAEAFAGARAEPYTEADLEAASEELGMQPEEMKHRWIIQSGSSFYVYCNGRYHCYGRDSIGNAVLRDLAPAISLGVSLDYDQGKTVRKKTISELMADYGSVATDVIVDLSAQNSHYDPIARAFIEAPCPVRVTAEYSLEVERWLQILAGPRADKLNDWLACLTRLNEPCAALYLEGPGGAGKSLLATGASRVFSTDRPADLASALAEYNDDMIRCPIVLADESVPKDFRGTMRTDQIREFIQARSRRLNRKYMPIATLRGCARVILAANNRNLLSTSEHLTEHDIGAIVERFLFIPVSAKARAYLNTVDVDAWMERDAIAKHIVWLSENLEVKKTGRFLVSGEAADLTNTLSTGTGLRAGLCQWAMGLLLRPSTMMNGRDWAQLVRASRGRLLVTARAMAEHWTEYVPDKGNPPSPSQISRALAGLSSEVTVRYPDGNRKMRSFNLDQLAVWAEETGYADRSLIDRAVAKLETEMNLPPLLELVAEE